MLRVFDMNVIMVKAAALLSIQIEAVEEFKYGKVRQLAETEQSISMNRTVNRLGQA